MSMNDQKLFSEVFNDYLVYAKGCHKKQGFDALERNFRNHVLPYFKDRIITSIDKKDIIEWKTKIYEKNFCNSFNSALFYQFSTFIEFCMIYSYFDKNIVLEVGNFKKKPEVKKDDYYTLREFRTFRKGLDNFVIKQFFNFIFFVGTRPGEAMALRFCDVEDDIVHICHNIERKGKRELTTPKNQSSIRDLDLSLLERIRIYSLKCYYTKHYGNFENEYYIFGGKKPLSPTTIDRYKENACKKMNIRAIRQHDFRHSCATNKIHNKVSIEEVSAQLGHSKVSTTVDIYLHRKKRARKAPHRKVIFFDALERILKKIFQSIITHFVA